MEINWLSFKKKNILIHIKTFEIPTKNPRENGLKDYLDAQNVKQSEWKAFVSYSEKVNQGKKYGNIRPKPLNDLHLMVRDGQNKVYLPGSSIKGAIKTALVSKYNNEKIQMYIAKLKSAIQSLLMKDI